MAGNQPQRVDQVGTGLWVATPFVEGPEAATLHHCFLNPALDYFIHLGGKRRHAIGHHANLLSPVCHGARLAIQHFIGTAKPRLQVLAYSIGQELLAMLVQEGKGQGNGRRERGQIQHKVRRVPPVIGLGVFVALDGKRQAGIRQVTLKRTFCDVVAQVGQFAVELGCTDAMWGAGDQSEHFNPAKRGVSQETTPFQTGFWLGQYSACLPVKADEIAFVSALGFVRHELSQRYWIMVMSTAQEVPMFPLSQTQSTVMSDTNDAFNIIRLWCLRALVTLAGHKILLKTGPSNGELAEFLGLTTQAGTADFDGKKALRALKQNHAHYEAQADSYQVPQVLQENVAAVAALVGLSETECRMLEFVVLLHMELLLESAMECLGDLTISKVALALSVVLKRPLEEVKQVLTNQSPLIRSGLIKPDRRYVGVLRCKLHLLSDQFADRMLSEVTDPDCLISDRVVQGQCSQLGFDDYGHLAQQVRLLRCYLEQV